MDEDESPSPPQTSPNWTCSRNPTLNKTNTSRKKTRRKVRACIRFCIFQRSPLSTPRAKKTTSRREANTKYPGTPRVMEGAASGLLFGEHRPNILHHSPPTCHGRTVPSKTDPITHAGTGATLLPPWTNEPPKSPVWAEERGVGSK